MKFAIQINASPYQSAAGETAYQFAISAIATGHKIYRIFFYYDGIYHGNHDASPPEDEVNYTNRWRDLAKQYSIDLVICISAAHRRGLLCEEELQRRGEHKNSLMEGFRISGLGQWVEAALEADRVVIF
ncbi:MAG: sulfurtransferase complex subunit TusD [Methylococcaceae bacterium]